MKHSIFFIFLLFTIGLSAQYKTELIVAKDGTGDFKFIQHAIDEAKSFPDKRITIFIKNGVYNEKVKVHSWNTKITLKGESRSHTIITWDDYFKKIDRGRNSTFHTATLLVEGNSFRAQNLTIENRSGNNGQAIALAVIADDAQFKNCSMIGNQDTLYAAGSNVRQLYSDCYVEGTTDFIFGEATALFVNCVIHSKANSFITAASTVEGREFGFVFLECTLTADNHVTSVYLGRPWRQFAKTVFIKCEMHDHINPKGWSSWSSPKNESTVYYAEYKNIGPGAHYENRVEWSHQLTNRKAKKYKFKNILSSFDLPKMVIDN